MTYVMDSLAHDHRRGPLAPDSHRCPIPGPTPYLGAETRPGFQRAFVRAWGYPLLVGLDPPSLLEYEEDSRPGETAERVDYFEVAFFGEQLITSGDTTATEIARYVVPNQRLLVIEKLATYLRITPRTNGAPAGPTIVTNALTDPGLTPIEHPDPAVAPFTLEFRFLVEHWDDSQPPVLFNPGTPLNRIPHIRLGAGQLPARWTDLRYAWGSRYTDSHQAVFPGGSIARLFVIQGGEPLRWQFKVGGLLAGFTQIAGPRGFAYRNAVTRGGS